MRDHTRIVGGVAALAGALWIALAPAAQATSNEVVYVANADSGPVTGYTSSSQGAVVPTVVVAKPNLPNTVWDPWGVAFDSAGSMYVQTFLSDATSFVFAPGQSRPIRVFRGDGPDSRAIAVDASGYEYVATSESSAEIVVLPPKANGTPSNLYSVTPLRTIATDEGVWYPWPDILTVDNQRHAVIAAVARSQGGNAIEVFSAGPSGSSTPVRVIAGPHTQLGSLPDHVAVTYSAFTGRLYVAVSSSASTHIDVFAGDATGDATPVRTISGPATGLTGEVITGIADSQVTGDIYAMVKDAQFGSQGHVAVFGRLAQGNAAPVRTFTDACTRFVDAAGIAIH